MGAEAVCNVRYAGQVSEGKALLETNELIFRGDFRLRIPFRDIDISRLTDADGELSVTFGEGTAVFELGRNAPKWAEKIRNPRGLMEKLGVKTGQRVAVLGVADASFLDDLRARTTELSEGGLTAEADIVFYAADETADLVRLPELLASISKKGAIWIVSPKGKGARLKDVEIMAAAREAGLVDTKVVSFSDTHTALRFVIPVAKR